MRSQLAFRPDSSCTFNVLNSAGRKVMCKSRIDHRWQLVFVLFLLLYGSCASQQQYSFQVELVQRNWSHLSDAELDKLYRESVEVYEEGCGSGGTEEPTTDSTTPTSITTIGSTTPTSTVQTCPDSCDGCSGGCTLIDATYCKCPCIEGFKPVPNGCELLTCKLDTLTYTDNTTNVTFAETAAGYSNSSIDVCPGGTSNEGRPYGTRVCSLEAKWGEPTWLSTCNVILDDLAKTEIETPEQRLEVANDLEVVSSDPTTLNPESVTSVVDGLENVVNTTTLDTTTSSSVVNTVGNLLSVPETIQDDGQTEQLLSTLDAVGEKVELAEGEEYQEVTSTVAMAVVDLTPTSARSLTGVGYGVRDLSTIQEYGFRSDQLQIFQGGLTENFSSYINIPQTALENGKYRASFYALIDDALFPNGTNDVWSYSSSVVLSASLPNASLSEINNLNEPVEMKFALQPRENGTYQPENTNCGFWKDSSWSTQGASVKEVVGDTITCQFSHLTNFAALFNPNYSESRALNLITVIGCSISIVALLATILVFSFDKKTRSQGKGRTSFLMVNLAVSLILLNGSMLLSEMDFVITTKDACLSIAVFIHFFMFSSLAWMLVEGVMFFITMAYPIYMSRVMKNRYLFSISTVCAWLLPAIFVAAIVGVDPNNYRRDDDACWINNNGIIYFVVIPFSIIIGLNLALYIVVMYLYFRQRKRHRSVATRRQDRSLSDLLLSLALFVAMGGTWIFAIVLLAGTSDTLVTVFAYIFAILNSLQGLFLFLLFVVRHKVVQHLRKKQPQQSTRSDEGVGTTRTGANYTIPSTEVLDWMSLAVQIPRPSLKYERSADR